MAELHLWRIHDWILLRGTRRNRNRVCINHFLMNDRKGSLLIQHRNLLTDPNDELILVIEVARKTLILVLRYIILIGWSTIDCIQPISHVN